MSTGFWIAIILAIACTLTSRWPDDAPPCEFMAGMPDADSSRAMNAAYFCGVAGFEAGASEEGNATSVQAAAHHITVANILA